MGGYYDGVSTKWHSPFWWWSELWRKGIFGCRWSFVDDDGKFMDFAMQQRNITVTSWWARWRLKLPASRLFAKPFVQAQIEQNIKAPRRWPLWGESTGDRWIPLAKAGNAENNSIWWRRHEKAWAAMVVMTSSGNIPTMVPEGGMVHKFTGLVW